MAFPVKLFYNEQNEQKWNDAKQKKMVSKIARTSYFGWSTACHPCGRLFCVSNYDPQGHFNHFATKHH